MTLLEKDIERRFREKIKALGGRAYKFTSPSQRSVPDRLVVLPGNRVFFVELKAPGEKPTPNQAREHARLRALGCDVAVVDTFEGVNAWILERDEI
jgi:hypothetical protein